ncbi:MAG: hypothetical protein ABI461_13610 [Polyangiaceae bacterium]
MQLERCPNCGAEIAPGPDGRTGPCGYCHSKASGAIDPAALAATLGREMNDIHAFVKRLAENLESSFPDLTNVDRTGLFTKRVSKIEITTNPLVFKLEVHGSNVTAHKTRASRGISLKSETIPVAQWVAELSQALAQLANESEAAHRALGKIL